jgi:hypothetical protein
MKWLPLLLYVVLATPALASPPSDRTPMTAARALAGLDYLLHGPLLRKYDERREFFARLFGGGAIEFSTPEEERAFFEGMVEVCRTESIYPFMVNFAHNTTLFAALERALAQKPDTRLQRARELILEQRKHHYPRPENKERYFDRDKIVSRKKAGQARLQIWRLNEAERQVPLGTLRFRAAGAPVLKTKGKGPMVDALKQAWKNLSAQPVLECSWAKQSTVDGRETIEFIPLKAGKSDDAYALLVACLLDDADYIVAF